MCIRDSLQIPLQRGLPGDIGPVFRIHEVGQALWPVTGGDDVVEPVAPHIGPGGLRRPGEDPRLQAESQEQGVPIPFLYPLKGVLVGSKVGAGVEVHLGREDVDMLGKAQALHPPPKSLADVLLHGGDAVGGEAGMHMVIVGDGHGPFLLTA